MGFTDRQLNSGVAQCMPLALAGHASLHGLIDSCCDHNKSRLLQNSSRSHSAGSTVRSRPVPQVLRGSITAHILPVLRTSWNRLGVMPQVSQVLCFSERVPW